MTPITDTVTVAGRDITVRELDMQEIRRLLGLLDLKEIEAAKKEASGETDDPQRTGEQWLAVVIANRFSIDGVGLTHVEAMCDLKPVDYAAAKPSELGALIEKIKQLNPFFFTLHARLLHGAGSSPDLVEPPANLVAS